MLQDLDYKIEDAIFSTRVSEENWKLPVTKKKINRLNEIRGEEAVFR